MTKEGRKTNQKKSPKKRTKTSTASLDTLQKAASANRDEFNNAPKTRSNYAGYIKNGKLFLSEIVAARRVQEAEKGSCNDDIDTDEFEKAFDDPPNQYSATALELFLTQKCCTEGNGKSTAEGIQGAFIKLWDTMDGDGAYAGEYRPDKKTGKILGCPGRAPVIRSFVKAIKVKAKAKGAAATRKHAEAMTVEELRKIMEWSESLCPSSEAASVNVGTQEEVEKLLLVMKHVLMRAFLTSGFILWTRNFELCGLQAKDLTFDCEGVFSHLPPYFIVFLENRKGWQKAAGYDGPRTSNKYNIYAQPDKPEMDMFTYLPLWISLLERCLGRKLLPDDYIFPFFSVNGTVHPNRELTHEMIQSLISEFASGAGLEKLYTTHSLRRGGAQYRFMYAPLKERWSLTMIRWWGGWAIGHQQKWEMPVRPDYAL